MLYKMKYKQVRFLLGCKKLMMSWRRNWLKRKIMRIRIGARFCHEFDQAVHFIVKTIVSILSPVTLIIILI